MNYHFQQGKRPERNEYVGAWKETGWREINLPFTCESLVVVLSWGAGERRSEHTHQDIAHWCADLTWANYSSEPRHDGESAYAQLVDIAQDVSVQWELYLLNTYSLKQLQALTLSTVVLPVEWFQDWLQRARNLHA